MFGGKRYNVQVTTGKAKGAGTNATVKIVLIDHEGKKSEEKVLDKWSVSYTHLRAHETEA